MTLLQEALAPRSDQLNADDLIAGPRTVTITGARFVQGDRGGKRILISYDGDQGKPFKPCKTMGRAMVMVWGITDDPDEAKVSAQFVGKSMTLYRDPTVDFGPDKGVGGIRISHMSDIDSPKTVKLTVSQGKKSNFVFKPLTGPKLAVSNTLSLDQARCDIANATNLDDLKTVWSRKSMAPHRTELQGDLDARKASLAGDTITEESPSAEEGPSDEDRGEAHNDADQEAPF